VGNTCRNGMCKWAFIYVKFILLSTDFYKIFFKSNYKEMKKYVLNNNKMLGLRNTIFESNISWLKGSGKEEDSLNPV
jgi:hypothetical protein